MTITFLKTFETRNYQGHSIEMFHKSHIGHPKKRTINTLIHTFVQNLTFAYSKFCSISKELHEPHLKK